MLVKIKDEEWELHHHKAMYWKREDLLLVSDLHLGKVSHFRKAGMAVPLKALERNFYRLQNLMDHFEPSTVMFLGDLFHSSYNEEWETFSTWLSQYENVKFLLVEGNHDILNKQHYESAGLTCSPKFEIDPYLFQHFPIEENQPEEKYVIAGHVHPGVTLQGPGKLRERFPCFYFGARQAILPAFGALTGFVKIKLEEHDKVFIIAEDKIVDVSKQTGSE